MRPRPGDPMNLRLRCLLAALLFACLPARAQTLVTLPSGTGYNAPSGAAADSQGNVFVADELDNQVKEIPFTQGTGYGTPVVLATISNPTAIVVDSLGNLLISTGAGVYELPFLGPGYSTTTVPLATGIGGGGLAFDGSGNLFVATPQYQIVNSNPTGAVHELPYTPGTGYGTPQPILTGVAVLEGLAVDGSGNVYATAPTAPGLYKVPYIGSGLYGSAQFVARTVGYGIAVDTAGNLYLNTTVNGTIYTLPGGNLSAALVPVTSGLPNTIFITAQGTGALFLGSTSLNQVYAIELPPKAVQQIAALTLIQNAAAGGTTPPVAGTLGAPPYSYSATLPTGLSLDPATGLITGTPTSLSAAADYIVTVTDAHGLTATASFNLTIAPPVTATASSTSYSTAVGDTPAPFQPVTAGLGAPPYSYAAPSPLPDGLSLDPATGIVSGTVQSSFAVPVGGVVNGSYGVTVTDSAGGTASASFALNIYSPVTATQNAFFVPLTQSNPVAVGFIPVVGASGVGPLGYSVSPSLPAGLSLDPSTGALIGTATATSSSSSYTVKVTDAQGGTAQNNFFLAINPTLTATVSNAAIQFTQGEATFLAPITFAGGTAPLTYSMTGTLPSGLSLGSGGIGGDPAVAAATANYSITATDANGATATGNFTLTVNPPVTATAAIPTLTLTRTQASISLTPVQGAGGTAPVQYHLQGTLPAGLSFDSTSGLVTGSPTATFAADSFRVTVVDAYSDIASAQFTLSVAAAPTASALLQPTVLTAGQPSVTLVPISASGGVPALTYSISPSLPAGLSLAAATGTITGSPTGSSPATSYTVTATDSNGVGASASVSLAVDGAVTATQSVATETLTQGFQGSFTPVTGGGGKAPLVYGIAPALPAGLFLNTATGLVLGTPTAPGSPVSYIVTVTDANSATASSGFSLAIAGPVTAVQSGTVPTPTQGHAVTAFTPVTGSGGVAPLSYSVSPALPSGMSLAADTGLVSGIPGSSGQSDYLVTATDANGASAHAFFHLFVYPAVTATDAIASTALTAGAAAPPFTPVTSTGGASPWVYTVAPSLPAGLTLDPAAGQITGTPTVAAGSASYLMTVTDGNGASASAGFGLLVNPAPTSSVTLPSTVLTQNQPAIDITPVGHSGGTAPFSFSVSPSLPAGLALDTGTGEITGKPSAVSGLTSYSMTVADSNQAQAPAAAFSLTVNPAVTATPAVASTVLPLQQAATPFTPVTAGGGTGALSYGVAPALPAGLSLAAATGTISGTPTAPQAPTSFTMTVTDTNGATAAAQFSLGVGAQASSAALTASANPSSFGQAVTFTAILSGKGGTPSGTVTFKDGATTLFTGTLANGISSYTTAELGVGSHALSISYSGDSLFAGSSGGLTELVNGTTAAPGQSYTYQTTLGTPGIAKPDGSHFDAPSAIAVDTVHGHLLIADSGNQRVQVLDAGTLAVVATLGTTGVAGSDDAHFDEPSGVGFDAGSDRIFVTDRGNDRIQVFDAGSFAYVATLAAGFDAPGGVQGNAATGQLYVADTGNQRVQIFDAATLAFIGTLDSDAAPFNAPKDAAVNPAVNEILVADSGNGRVQRFDATTFAYKGMIGGAGLALSSNDYLGTPVSVSYDPVGNLILVADAGAGQRIQVFDALSYNYVLTLGTTGSAGSGNAQFSTPSGAAVDAAHGRLFIGDSRNDRIQVFSIAPTPVFASVLPGSRSVQLGHPATIFASLVNAGTLPLQGCRIALPVTAPAGLTLSYQTTDAGTNAPTGLPDTPATIAANDGVQSFLVTLQGPEAVSVPGMALDFGCLGIGPAAVETGVDTVDLTLSATPVADIVALAATASNNGIAEIPSGGTGAFAVASDNVGAGAQIIASVDTGAATLTLTPTICQSNPGTGACLGTPAGSVTVNFTAGSTPTFSIFLKAGGTIPLDPANSRVFVRFKDTAGALHGSTSVAVETQ